MLTVHDLKKSFDLQLLFENVSFSLNQGDRFGLVGPNGCGKTTLLRILAGIEQPSAGHVSHNATLKIGYLPQQSLVPVETGEQGQITVGEIIGSVYGNPEILEREVIELATALAQANLDPQKKAGLEAHYDDLLRQIQSADTGSSAKILAGLGLNGIEPNFPATHLSGGQKTRLSLALILLDDPQLLLLDEPTNHLDIAMLEWLEGWLKACDCGALIVSHDRAFIDHTVDQILELDQATHHMRTFAGNYSAYLEQRQADIEQQWATYKDQQQEIRQMQQDIARTKAQAAYTERQASSIRIGGPDMKIKGWKDYQQHIAKKVARKAVSREKKLDRYLDSEERVEKPQRSWLMKIDFDRTPHLGSRVIQTEKLSIGYDPATPLLVDLDLEVRSGRRIAITGPNGSGKTTLLRTILGHLPPLAGYLKLGSSVRLGYMSQDQSELVPDVTVLDTLIDDFHNQTEARQFLSYFLFSGDEPLKPIRQISQGQRARLILAKLVAEQANCLLLDEPINHLDIPSREQFEQALSRFEGTILAVVHDRYFIERFADEVWWVDDGRVRVQLLR